MTFLDTLNPPQKEAVLHTEGPLMILAGAGSGKTRMLTARIAYLIEKHLAEPWQILAVTFTNKAAEEMKERVRALINTTSFIGFPEIGTFHAICLRVLRKELQYTPFEKGFVIYDDSDQLSLIKSIQKNFDLDQNQFAPKALQTCINRFKCDALEPDDLACRGVDSRIVEFYRVYQKELFKNQALDFGEILCLMVRVLRDHREVRTKYQKFFSYLHVDEFQDTNRVQYLLLSLLTASAHGGNENLCIVGDEDQSIYKWRGADIRNILDFKKDFPKTKMIKLEQNYRSTQTIVSAASYLIQHNRERNKKILWTENTQGMPILRIHFPDERAEAAMAVSEIKRLCQNEGYAYSDFAIFYRTHAQSRQFEDVFRREKISHKLIGGLRFYDRKEIKDILAYFKVILNPLDSVSLRRIINVPGRGIGKTTIEKCETLTKEKSLWGVFKNPSELGNSVVKKLSGFVSLIQKFQSEQPCITLVDLYSMILEDTGYIRELKQEGTIEAMSRIENLEELSTVLQEFEEDVSSDVEKKELLPLFLEQALLIPEDESQNGFSQDAGFVSLMTLHSSKGLEFPVVFMVGMEEGLFPSIKIWEETSEEIEEERRLCYVGMTRARERLYLFHAAMRRIWGEILVQKPARFFLEIPEEFIEYRDFSYGLRPQSFRIKGAFR
ncbi:MAG: UvrD-helicase domain-containing protein [Deltaproteobacteria bacterium]|nr:UvrD-helicase domain-containing protein [Deltaproteobacteria bacterium]